MWWVNPLLVFARHYVVKFKKPLLYAAGAAALFGGGFASGWSANENRHLAEDARKAETKVERVIEQVVVRDEVERKVYVQDLAQVRKLEAERDRLRAQNVALQERVDLYVPQNAGPDGSGYLSVGAVRLLNDATSGAGTSTAAPAASVEEALAASTVSWRDLTRYTVRIAGTYNDAMLQCNALIDWVDVNIVNKPAVSARAD